MDWPNAFDARRSIHQAHAQLAHASSSDAGFAFECACTHSSLVANSGLGGSISLGSCASAVRRRIDGSTSKQRSAACTCLITVPLRDSSRCYTTCTLYEVSVGAASEFNRVY